MCVYVHIVYPGRLMYTGAYLCRSGTGTRQRGGGAVRWYGRQRHDWSICHLHQNRWVWHCVGMCCRCVAGVVQVCCKCGAGVLHWLGERRLHQSRRVLHCVAGMLQVCCRYVTGVLQVCCSVLHCVAGVLQYIAPIGQSVVWINSGLGYLSKFALRCRKDAGFNERFQANLNLYQVPFYLYWRSLFVRCTLAPY